MIVKLLTEHHLEFLSLKGGCRGVYTCQIVGNHMSRLNSILPGGLDQSVKIWDIAKVMKEIDREMDASIPSSLSL